MPDAGAQAPARTQLMIYETGAFAKQQESIRWNGSSRRYGNAVSAGVRRAEIAQAVKTMFVESKKQRRPDTFVGSSLILIAKQAERVLRTDALARVRAKYQALGV